jgi:hypothetical protein
MGLVVENGVGNANKLKIDANNRAHVQAISESESLHSSEIGDGYNINTGQIAYTGAGESSVIYFKNDEATDFVVEALAIGNDGGGTYSARPLLTLIANPTGGDIITDATAVAANANRNFGSNKNLGSGTLTYKGKEGGTITGGETVAILQSTQDGRDFFTINFILPKGASFGVKIDNNLSSGTANIYAAIIGFLKDPEGTDK